MVRKVVHIVYGFHIGGLEKLIVNCINQMGEAYQHTIISLTTVGDIVEQLEQNVTTMALNKSPGNSLKLYGEMYRLLTDLKPDVVHTYNLATIEFQLVAALARVPMRIHAEHGRDTYDPYGKVKKYQYLRKLCALGIHRLVAVSDDLYRWLKNDVGIRPRQLQLIRNGINTRYFSPTACHFSPTANHEPRQRFTFGHVARLESVKNQPLLIKAYQQACIESPDFAQQTQLIIVGDGDQRAHLEAMVAEGPLNAQIEFAGRQTDMRSQYARFDAFVLTSIAEGIPLTLLESMSMALPHIVTTVGGISEVILPGETGCGIASNDQQALTRELLHFYHQQPAAIAMGQRARDHIEQHFSEKAMVSAYEAIYNAGS
ncbi:glycosyltransferase [Photobacterium ganghwense]|uniref:glycosyltransferase n=1 Tax=Photobacterium ganghwense TaxID=320778 RepID=UPI001C2D6259|nr:glycosyltransferase [Photobacterium ganghwense]MBV1842063.1 glycosyltransferase [Photobacterium ganghwense]